MLEKIQQWFLEAARLHGDDWANIESYVAGKIAGASSADHRLMREQLRALFGDRREILH